MMKINQKLLSIAVLGAILGLASCNNDDETPKLGADQSKAKLEEVNQSVVTDLQDLSDADGINAIKDLVNLVDTDDPFTSGRIGTDKKSISAFFRERSKDLRKVFIPTQPINARVQGDEPFDYAAHKGIYSWDSESSTFIRTGDSEEIDILFPTEGSLTNNAKLKITSYSEVELVDSDNYVYYNPTAIKASLLVSDTEIASLDFSATWADDGFPTQLNITLFVNPFTATLSFTGTASSSTLATSLKKNTELLLATSVTVKFDNNTKTEENLNSVTGYVQIKDIKVQGTVDIKAADASQTGDPNEYIHLSVYTSNKKMGDVVFVNEDVNGNQEYVPYIKYSDGSTAKLEDVFDDAIAQLNTIIDNINGNNG